MHPLLNKQFLTSNRITNKKKSLFSSKKSYIFQKNVHKEVDQSHVLIRSVTTKKEFNIFMNVPSTIYQYDTRWISPIWKDEKNFFKIRNLFWSHADCALFIALMNNQPVGRIAGIIDDFFIKQSKKRTGFFGFYESINDEQVAHLLLSMVESWLISKNCTHMIGPIDGRVDNGAGFLLDSFRSQPTILDSYSPSYYLNFARKYGMKKHRDLLTFSIDLTVPLSDELKTSALKSKQENHIHLRRFNRWKSQSELRWWVPFFLDSFSAHWGYIPVDEKEVKQRYGLRNIRWVCDSDLFIIAENSNGPIGFLWGTPDYNQIFKKIDGTMDIISALRNIRYIKTINYGKLNVIGIIKEYQNRDLALLLNYEMLKRMQQRGYKGADIGWIDEHNSKALKVMEKTGAIHKKTFRVYEKEIHSMR